MKRYKIYTKEKAIIRARTLGYKIVWREKEIWRPASSLDSTPKFAEEIIMLVKHETKYPHMFPFHNCQIQNLESK